MTRRRLGAAEAARIIVGCCHTIAQRPLGKGVLAPERILLAEHGEVVIGDSGSEDFVAYGTPEMVTNARQAPPPRSWKVGAKHVAITEPTKEGVRIARDPRGVVFMLGSILWEMLAGAALFKSPKTDHGSLDLVERAEVPPIPGVPPTLDAILRKALARNPDDRYQSVIELGEALAGFLAPTAN